MRIQLEPETEPGRKATEIAESHIEEFSRRAASLDREGRFPRENFRDLYDSGYMGAVVPVELGGLGLESNLDMAVGTNRLARGCGSTALASNMARAGAGGVAGQWRTLQAQGNEAAASVVGQLLRGVVAGTVGFCGANSEIGTDPMHPRTEVRKDGGAWLLNGTKAFATASPIATHLNVMARWASEDRGERLVVATVPTALPGVTINDDWDAMGMRATGSPTVTFENVRLPAPLVRDSGPLGVWNPDSVLFIFLGTAGGLGQAAAFLGIAEAAQDYTIDRATTARKGSRRLAERSAVQQLVAESEIALSASVALLQDFGRRQEGRLREIRAARDVAEMHQLQRECQIARRFATEAAVGVVDRAMTVLGGSAYMSDSPISRMYRDVRAGPVMPMSPIDVYEYIGKVTLGKEPDIWL